MCARHVWECRGTEREHAGEEAGKVLKHVCRDDPAIWIYEGIGDVEEVALG
jgi:hypothetical protein